jgi:hypothetical protein
MQNTQPNPATPGSAVKDQPRLPSNPSSEQVLDVAVEQTFPASDATAIGASVDAAEEEAPGKPPKQARPSSADWEWPRSPTEDGR